MKFEEEKDDSQSMKIMLAICAILMILGMIAIVVHISLSRETVEQQKPVDNFEIRTVNTTQYGEWVGSNASGFHPKNIDESKIYTLVK